MSVKLLRPRSFCHDHSRPSSDILRGWLISVSLASESWGGSQPGCENKNLNPPRPCGYRCVPVPQRATHKLPRLCDSPFCKLISCRVIAAHDHLAWTAAHRVTHLSNKDFLFCFFFLHLGSGSQKGEAKGMNGKGSFPGTLGVQRKPAEGEILKPLRFHLLSSKRNKQQTQCLYSPAFSGLHGSRWDVSTWGHAEWYVEGRGLAPKGSEPTKHRHCVEKVLPHNVWKLLTTLLLPPLPPSCLVRFLCVRWANNHWKIWAEFENMYTTKQDLFNLWDKKTQI